MKRFFNKTKLLFGILSIVISSTAISFAIDSTQVQKGQVVEIDGAKVRAVFVGLSDKAKKQGLDKVYLEGQIAERDISNLGIKTLDISWSRIVDKVSENKVYLDEPLSSTDLKVKPDLEDGDEVYINGDLTSVVSKQQELIDKNSTSTDEDDEEEEEKDNDEDYASKSSSAQGYAPSSSTGSDNDSESAFDSEVTGQTNVVVTSDGCDIVADIPSMQANQYKRVLQDGEEIQGCSPSEVVYALTKDYSTCSRLEDLDSLKAYSRYTLGYIKEEGGTRTVVDGGYCNIDETTAVDIVENECGNETDYQNAKYYKKTNLTYSMDGHYYVAQACVRKESTVLDMQKDTNTCPPSFTGGYYTPYFNWYVEENGVYTSLSECLPDVENHIKLKEEVCSGKEKYTLDSDNGKAYLNKTYYYESLLGDKVEVDHCIASDTSYEYQTEVDDSICAFDFNDEDKTTLTKGYNYFIGENDERIEMKDKCVSVFPVIPYTPTGSIWKQSSIEEKVVANSADLQTLEVNRSDYTDGGKITYSWYYKNRSNNPCMAKKQYVVPPLNGNNDRGICFAMDLVSTATWQKYCLEGLTAPYDIVGLNVAIDVDNSTTLPTYSYQSPTSFSTTYGGIDIVIKDSTVNFKCSQPTCNVATLEKRPIYLRADGSEYIDETSTLETKYVCGENSPLLDTVE